MIFAPIYLKRIIFLISSFTFCFLYCSHYGFSQKKDSVPSVSSDSIKPLKSIPADTPQYLSHSPKKAAIMSACLPGLGQAYNHKYWKIPVVYVIVGTFGYLTYRMNSEYKNYKTAYIKRTDGDSGTIDNLPLYTESQLKENVDFYRHYRDMNAVLTTAFYLLNIIDAAVDAHLFTFDVSDNISLHINPSVNYFSFKAKPSTQFGLSFRF